MSTCMNWLAKETVERAGVSDFEPPPTHFSSPHPVYPLALFINCALAVVVQIVTFVCVYTEICAVLKDTKIVLAKASQGEQSRSPWYENGYLIALQSVTSNSFPRQVSEDTKMP